MSKQPSLLIDLLGIGRVANLPTVITNLCVGLAIAQILYPGDSLTALSLVKLLFSAILLYLTGTFLNDWHDSRWDQDNKPDRPIPSGRISQTRILSLAIGFFVFSAILIFPSGLYTFGSFLFITLNILLYTRFHKKTPLAVIPMGLCRAGLYPLAFFYFQESTGYIPHEIFDAYSASTLERIKDSVLILSIALLPYMIGLFSYIAGLSLLARCESATSKIKPNKVFAYFLLSFVSFTHVFHLAVIDWKLILLSLIPLTGLIVATRLIKKSISNGVSLLLANICLADLAFQIGFYLNRDELFEMRSPVPLIITAVCFPLAILLQKIAPAT